MNSNTDHLRHVPFGRGRKRAGGAVKAWGMAFVAEHGRGRFTAKQSSRLHEHNWIFGDECAVCTKCGYTIPKEVKPPERGWLEDHPPSEI